MVYLKMVLNAIIFIAILLSFGSLLTFLNNKSSTYILKTGGSKVFLCIAAIGTPIHELSHYIAAKLFLHHIEEVVLFSPKRWRQNGTLGYVNHAYSKRTFSRAGNFIIGVAPIIGCVGMFCLASKYVFGWNVFHSISSEMSFMAILTSLKNCFVGLFKIFNLKNMANPLFWLSLIILVCIFVNSSLSKADFKNSYVGLIFFILWIPLFSYVLSMFGVTSAEYLGYCIKINILFFVGLIVGSFISLVIFGFFYMCFCIKRIYYKKKKNLIIS